MVSREPVSQPVLCLDLSTSSWSLAFSSDGSKWVQASFERGDAFLGDELAKAHDEVMHGSDLALNPHITVCWNAGPGSFTALRVALATVQGWLWGLDNPRFAVSGLWALVWRLNPIHIPSDDTVAVCLPAGRGYVYGALFSPWESRWKRVEWGCYPADVFKERACRSVWFGGDGWMALGVKSDDENPLKAAELWKPVNAQGWKLRDSNSINYLRAADVSVAKSKFPGMIEPSL
jgi:tRNA threonylcarbamoyl adenosine modification protein YeaZ